MSHNTTRRHDPLSQSGLDSKHLLTCCYSMLDWCVMIRQWTAKSGKPYSMEIAQHLIVSQTAIRLTHTSHLNLSDVIRSFHVLLLFLLCVRESAGVDVSARNQGGSTALHWAASVHTPQQHTTQQIIKLLVNNGIQINTINKAGETPLHVSGTINRMRCHSPVVHSRHHSSLFAVALCFFFFFFSVGCWLAFSRRCWSFIITRCWSQYSRCRRQHSAA